jgi:hypothetical protein
MLDPHGFSPLLRTNAANILRLPPKERGQTGGCSSLASVELVSVAQP